MEHAGFLVKVKNKMLNQPILIKSLQCAKTQSKAINTIFGIE